MTSDGGRTRRSRQRTCGRRGAELRKSKASSEASGREGGARGREVDAS